MELQQLETQSRLGGLGWKEDGMKCLCVYLGEEEAGQRNCEGVTDTTTGNGYSVRCLSEEGAPCWFTSKITGSFCGLF